MTSPFNEQKYKDLLEGLEISEVWLSKVTKGSIRFDSDHYSKENLVIENLANSNSHTMSKLIEPVISGFDFRDFTNQGNHYIRVGDIKQWRIQKDNSALIEIAIREINKDISIKSGDIVFTRKGSFGNAALVFKEDEDCIISTEIIRIRLNEFGKKIINPEYLMVFLNSKFGKLQSYKWAHGIQFYSITQVDLLKFVIPIISNEIQIKIKNNVQTAYNKSVQSQFLYRQAEELLLEKVGLKDFKPSEKGINIKSFKESFLATGRLDAEYYQPKYEEIRNILTSYKGGFEYLEKLCITYRGNFVEECFYTENKNKYAYIRGADISSNVMIADKMTYLNEKFVNTNENLVQKGDIVMALIGSVGTAALVTENFVNSIVSNNLGFIRINSDKILPEYLHLYLTQKNIGGLLFAQQEMRTAQPKISDKNVHNFPVPLVDIQTQHQISALIQESFSLRKESEGLLAEAKEMVEGEIEKGII
ncbi:MAG: restriction endonuclease subunit S [Marinilabiliaceae bacterium]|nr:restriction endonuclease subunit S [Marinilabiliaceae bacterium]